MATIAHLGTAVPIREQKTLTLGGTWVAADTITLTINGKDLVLTVGTTVTTTAILDNVLIMITGSGTYGAGYSSNALGSVVGEFKKLSLVKTSTTVATFTGMTDGQDFDLSVDKSSTSGTVAVTTTVTGTGPHHFGNADNWDGGVPADADDIVFDHRSAADLKYDLAQSAITPASVTITEGFAHEIGLPDINADDTTYKYNEYRDTHLVLGNAADATNMVVSINAPQSRRIRISNGTGQVTGTVTDTSTRRWEPHVPVMTWIGTHADNVWNVTKGDVGLGFAEDDTATVDVLRQGWIENQNGDAKVVCGPGVTLGTIDKSGGSLTVASNVTTLTQNGGETTVLAGAVTTAEIDAGSLKYRSAGTVTNLVVGAKGILDCRQDMRARTVTNAEFHRGSSLRDPHGTVTWTNGIDFVRCTPADLAAFEVPPNKTWTPTSI